MFVKIPDKRILLTIITIIALGILSRSSSMIPLIFGDILWAALFFFIFKIFLNNLSDNKIIITTLFFSYSIEFSQLYQAPWLNEIRQTLFGKLILGNSFTYLDLAAYLIGILLAAKLSKKLTY